MNLPSNGQMALEGVIRHHEEAAKLLRGLRDLSEIDCQLSPLVKDDGNLIDQVYDYVNQKRIGRLRFAHKQHDFPFVHQETGKDIRMNMCSWNPHTRCVTIHKTVSAVVLPPEGDEPYSQKVQVAILSGIVNVGMTHISFIHSARILRIMGLGRRNHGIIRLQCTHKGGTSRVFNVLDIQATNISFR